MIKRNFKLNSLFLILILLIGSRSAFAAGEDIQVVLIQPAVYAVKKGDKLDYKVEINLPKDYTKKYKSFAVTVMFDEHLSVEGNKLEDLEPVPGKIVIAKSTLSAQKKDVLTFSANDLSALKGSNQIDIWVNTKVKESIKAGENFKNSFVITFVDKSGKEDSSQKDLISSTMGTKGQLTVEEVTEESKAIIGKTDANIYVKVFKDKEQLAEGKTDEKGNYKITILPQSANTKLTVKAYVNKDGKTDELSKQIVVKANAKADINADAKEKEVEEGINLIEVNNSSNKDVKILKDYVSTASKIDPKKATVEEQAALKAAIANGEYIAVKSDVKSAEIEAAIEKLKTTISPMRPPYMSGTSKTTFRPNNKVKRLEVAVIFTRLLAGDNTGGNYTSFDDVKETAWYADSIGYIEKSGLMKGYADGKFMPEKEITRAEFATIIANYANLDHGSDPIAFKDVKEKHWAKETIDKVSASGIMVGSTNKNFSPDKALSRAEITSVINKILDRVPDKEFILKYSKNPFTDVKQNFWAYPDILEATGN